jgi:hypothetical protein
LDYFAKHELGRIVAGPNGRLIISLFIGKMSVM